MSFESLTSVLYFPPPNTEFTNEQPAISKPKQRRLKKRQNTEQILKQCFYCKITETAEWRTGPGGPQTLCNYCGIHWSRSKNLSLGELTKEKKSARKITSKKLNLIETLIKEKQLVQKNSLLEIAKIEEEHLKFEARTREAQVKSNMAITNDEPIKEKQGDTENSLQENTPSEEEVQIEPQTVGPRINVMAISNLCN